MQLPKYSIWRTAHVACKWLPGVMNKSKRLTSFAPVCRDDAETLFLGSMPGRASLEAGQYYAHKQNAFWYIMGQILEPSADMLALSYQKRCQILIKNKIALWDVLRHCKRTGSLDSAIERDSVVPNDFVFFLQKHPNIDRIFFNGTRAMQEFRRHVLPLLKDSGLSKRRKILLQKLPSTSPAHARLDKSQKLKIWKEAVELSSKQQSPFGKSK